MSGVTGARLLFKSPLVGHTKLNRSYNPYAQPPYGTSGTRPPPTGDHVTKYIHRESKKQDTKLLAITSLNIIRFSKLFH